MQGPSLNTLQNDGVHGRPSSTLQGACENGVASIWRRDWASAAPIPANRPTRQTMMQRNMQRVLTGDPTKLVRVLARIKADGVHIPAFMADSSAIRAFSPGMIESWRSAGERSLF